jgi:hypothetical protein
MNFVIYVTFLKYNLQTQYFGPNLENQWTGNSLPAFAGLNEWSVFYKKRDVPLIASWRLFFYMSVSFHWCLNHLVDSHAVCCTRTITDFKFVRFCRESATLWDRINIRFWQSETLTHAFTCHVLFCSRANMPLIFSV